LEEEDPKEFRRRKMEEAIEAYNAMLKEKVDSPDMGWEEVLKLIEKDPR
jgi:hypothetical protein